MVGNRWGEARRQAFSMHNHWELLRQVFLNTTWWGAPPQSHNLPLRADTVPSPPQDTFDQILFEASGDGR